MTPECPKGPESNLPPRSLRDHVAAAIAVRDGRHLGLEPLADATYEEMADVALAFVGAEVERLTAEVDRLKREGSPGVMHKVDAAFHRLALSERDLARQNEDRLRVEVSRLREQLAAQPKVPADADELVSVALNAATNRCNAALSESLDIALTGAVMDLLRSWGVSSSEVEAPQPQEWIQHHVYVRQDYDNGALWVAVCDVCGPSTAGDLDVARSFKDQHEADTLRPVADEGRPSGSERLAPRPVEARVKTATPEEFDSTYKGHGGQCTSTNGTPEYRCEWMVGHEGDHRRYVGPYRWELWQDAAQAARSEATPIMCRQDCEAHGAECRCGEPLFHRTCCHTPPSPSLRKEGEDTADDNDAIEFTRSLGEANHE